MCDIGVSICPFLDSSYGHEMPNIELIFLQTRSDGLYPLLCIRQCLEFPQP